MEGTALTRLSFFNDRIEGIRTRIEHYFSRLKRWGWIKGVNNHGTKVMKAGIWLILCIDHKLEVDYNLKKPRYEKIDPGPRDLSVCGEVCECQLTSLAMKKKAKLYQGALFTNFMETNVQPHNSAPSKNQAQAKP